MTNLKKEDEIVVVVNNKELFNDKELYFQGVQTNSKTVEKIMENINDNYYIMRRGSVKELETPVFKNAELNFEYKQPIPYVIIKRGDEMYIYERLTGGGESRLHHKLSCGWGGHQNPLDSSLSVPFSDVVLDNLNRELEEELSITSSSRKLDFIGLINDDLNQVGKVHLGILAVMELSDDATVEVNEVEQLRGHWMNVDQLKSPEVFERLESWSQIAAEVL